MLKEGRTGISSLLLTEELSRQDSISNGSIDKFMQMDRISVDSNSGNYSEF